jgi:hypothetical protein
MRRAVVLVGVVLSLGWGSGATAVEPVEPVETVDMGLQPNEGLPAESIDVTGSLADFCADAEVVTVVWRAEEAPAASLDGESSPDPDGLSITVPAEAAPGDYEVEARCSPLNLLYSDNLLDLDDQQVLEPEQKVVGFAGFTVLEPPVTEVAEVQLNPESAEPGARVRASGTGFPSGCTPTLTLAGEEVATERVEALGLEFSVPRGTPQGVLLVQFDCGEQTDSAELTVQPSTTSDQPRPSDGSSPRPQTNADPPAGTSSSAAAPSSSSTTTSTPAPTSTGQVAGVNQPPDTTAPPPPSAGGPEPARPDFTESLMRPDELSWDLQSIARSLGLAVLLLFVIGFPAELFNKTMEENRHRLPTWFRRDLPPGTPALPWWHLAGFALVSAAMLSLVEAGAGFDAETAVLAAAMLIAVVATFAFYSGTGEFFARDPEHSPASLRTLWVGFVVAAACVAVSRLVGLQPGYAYGLLAFFAVDAVAAERRARRQGPAVLLGAVVLLMAGMLSWLVWSFVDVEVTRSGAGPLMLIVDSALAATTVLALQGVVFGLVPIEYMDGRKLRTWNGPVWLATWALAVFLFTHVLFQKYLTDAEKAPGGVLAAFTPFLLFGALSFGLWLYLRRTAEPPGPDPDLDEDPGDDPSADPLPDDPTEELPAAPPGPPAPVA